MLKHCSEEAPRATSTILRSLNPTNLRWLKPLSRDLRKAVPVGPQAKIVVYDRIFVALGALRKPGGINFARTEIQRRSLAVLFNSAPRIFEQPPDPFKLRPLGIFQIHPEERNAVERVVPIGDLRFAGIVHPGNTLTGCRLDGRAHGTAILRNAGRATIAQAGGVHRRRCQQ